MINYALGEVLLDIQNVSFSFGAVPVLRNFTAQIRDILRPGYTQGQVEALLAPSGMGKSTCFKLLAGLLKPTSGQILVDGKPTHPGLVGVVAQHYPLLKDRTVYENLLFAGRQAGLSGGAAQVKVLELLLRFGLVDRENAWSTELSGGQRQRVAILQQLLCSNHVLLMDEPFSGLDPVAKDEACALIREVASHDERFTTVIVTHDIASAVAVADTIWLMGRERVDGKPVPGAKLIDSINLIERGLAWQPDVEQLPAFAETVREIRARFKTL